MKLCDCEGAGGVSPRPVQGALQHPGEPPVLCDISPATASALAARALRRGRAGARPPARRRRQVPHPSPLPAAAYHLGRRADVVLLPRAVTTRAARVVRTESVPVAAAEARAGRDDGSDERTGE